MAEETDNAASQACESFIPASVKLPEITIKAVIVAIFLTIILAGANAFLGLKVGMTVSASIPAAVISMGILRFFKHYNVLENNIVQTAASSGEALAAGIVFTMPALIIIKYWGHFNYWHTAIIAILGGTIGVLFSIPLRRALLADKTLKFPEGTAIGNVLKVSASSDVGLSDLVLGGGLGAIISLCQNGFKLFGGSLQLWFQGAGTVFGFGVGFDTALIGAGYIIGTNVALTILLGIGLGWLVGVPIIADIYGYDHSVAMDQVALSIWSDHIRYIGLGTMMVGGIWAVVSLVKPIIEGVNKSISILKDKKAENTQVIRTEHDIPINYVGWGILILLVPIYFLINHYSGSDALGLSNLMLAGTNGLSLMIVLIGGFIVSSICAYFAGLVGSSTNPLSSLVLISLIIASLILALLFGHGIDLGTTNIKSISLSALAIMITAVIAAAAAISNDTIQDLKAGQMVGATPWKQQAMLILGVIVSALVIPYILQLLFDAYGMAGVFPRPGMDPSQMLLAPQAGLMAAVVQAIFTHQLNWIMMCVGGVIAVIVLVIDHIMMKKTIYRLPVLAVGIGIYLPVTTASALVIGGLLAYFVNRAVHKKGCKNVDNKQEIQRSCQQRALLLACGLVAGAAIMGVLLAIPFALEGSTNALSLISSTSQLPPILGVLVTLALCFWFVKRSTTVNLDD